MRKVILHIGPHKTGSTYLQKMLYENRDKITAQGVGYADICKDGLIAHHQLAEKLINKDFDSANNILQKIFIKSTEDITIISSENFDMLSIEAIEFLANTLCMNDTVEVKVIFFKRKFDDLIISNWQESIKHGNTQSCYHYLLNHISAPYSSSVLNITGVLEKYSKYFGKENLIIIDYNQAKEERKDIIDIFFQSINKPEIKNIGTKAHINNSLNYTLVEVIRGLNILFYKKYKKNPYDTIRNKFLLKLKNKFVESKVDILIESIEQNLENINLGETFVFNLLNNQFDKIYQENIINYNKINYNKKIISIPNDSWMLDINNTKCLNDIFNYLDNEE
ncbi:hypothetical protein MLC35_01055 [Sulfurimonas sp. NW7]|uniref:hypothetical protein n=1 Tax=Sulfurimonas sp. NW7 TaxID=2922727 RepID=UPI003DA7E66D